MGNARTWLYRAMVLLVIALMVVSWLLPWWRAVIVAIDNYVQIRPWGLETDLGTYASYISSAQMPGWFAPFMWAYLGIAVLAVLVSLFLKDKAFKIWKFKFNLPTFITGLVGVSYIIVAITAVVFAIISIADFYIPINFIGHSFFTLEHPVESDVEASLQLGYWLACAAGPLLVALALLRNKIIGKKEISA
jgi:hypothetical protein